MEQELVVPGTCRDCGAAIERRCRYCTKCAAIRRKKSFRRMNDQRKSGGCAPIRKSGYTSSDMMHASPERLVRMIERVLGGAE